jgi:hypothetical protein
MTKNETKANTGKRMKKKTLLGRDLDRLIGTWSRPEARDFDRALKDQRRIDPELWK